MTQPSPESEDGNGRDGVIPSWDEFSGRRSLFDRLIDINDFAIVCQTAPLPEVNDGKFSQTLSASLYSHALRAVETAKFFGQDQLRIQSRAGMAGIMYGDDKYDFRIDVDDDTIYIRRSGSKLSDFHEWYTAMGHAFSPLIAGVLEELEKATSRKFSIFRAAFTFKFLTYDHLAENNSRRIRNSEIMRKLLIGMPDEHGTLSQEESVFESALRLDVSFSRWVTNPDSLRRNERYSVEAPANKSGAGLWFTFTYGGETFTSPLDGRREVFAHEGFFDEFDIAYADFLRDRALLTFLKQLLDGVKFSSTSGNLP